MPDFQGNVPTVVFKDISVELYSYKKTKRTLSIPDNGATDTEILEAVTAVGNSSNMGVLSWSSQGTKTYIYQGQVNVNDDTHTDTETLRLIFQDATDLTKPEITISVPAPKRAMFKNGVIFDEASVLGASLVLKLLVLFNAPTALPLASYTFRGGALNTASALEKRSLPVISDPV